MNWIKSSEGYLILIMRKRIGIVISKLNLYLYVPNIMITYRMMSTCYARRVWSSIFIYSQQCEFSGTQKFLNFICTWCSNVHSIFWEHWRKDVYFMWFSSDALMQLKLIYRHQNMLTQTKSILYIKTHMTKRF